MNRFYACNRPSLTNPLTFRGECKLIEQPKYKAPIKFCTQRKIEMADRRTVGRFSVPNFSLPNFSLSQIHDKLAASQVFLYFLASFFGFLLTIPLGITLVSSGNFKH